MDKTWSRKPIRNILLDINGVLFNSGESDAISGSVKAMQMLVDEGFKFCLLTNECTSGNRWLTQKLNNMGFTCVTIDKIVSPAPAACEYLMKHNLKPQLHVWDSILEDFEPVLKKYSNDTSPPNCLVIGDVLTKLSRDFVDHAVETMIECPVKPTILALGTGRYYREADRLRMDTGGYVKAFEHCLGVKAINVGKPSEQIFRTALRNVGGSEEDTIMIGDDVVSDVGGAKALGMRGFLVRTGKYKPSDENCDSSVRPDRVFDNLNQAIEMISKYWGRSARNTKN